MPSRPIVAVLAAAALLVPAASALAAQVPAGPPIPESITLPTKIVQGDSATGTVCLDRIPETATDVSLVSDTPFFVEVQPSVTITPPAQCADFTVTSFNRNLVTPFPVVILALANGEFAQRVLWVIQAPGVDLVEITKADVNRNFGKLTVVATSDEPGAVLTASAGGVELGQLEQRGDRYVGRFDLGGQPINNVVVTSNLGGCAQRAVPFGNNSTRC